MMILTKAQSNSAEALAEGNIHIAYNHTAPYPERGMA